ncbi:MAG: tRNA (adenosine(37)-N6)-threonylcarbamoyltransferase complex ATPase subunit type 1 TsaE [Acidimicrobiales bacterium]
MIEARTKSVDDTRALAAEMAPFARPGDLILLEGGLGTGKTAFVQGFAKGLGVTERVTSPTFVLVRSYTGRIPMVHLDVYRLDRMQELVDLGIAELLDEAGVTLIEWGDVVTPALPADFLEIRLEPGDTDDERRLRFRTAGPSWPPRLRAIGDTVARWSPGA